MIETLRRWRHTVIPLPVKYGRHFRETFDLLRNHRSVTREQIEEYQWRKLKALLDYAYRNVPYYREQFDSLGIKPEEIKTPADFRKLPVLTKDDVVAYADKLKSHSFDRFKPILTLTSGTTRDNTALYRSRETETWRSAVAWRHLFEIGYRFRDPRVRLSVPLRYLEDPFRLDIDYNENALMIDNRSLTIEHAPRIYRRMRKFRPKLIYAQPENIVQLAIYFRDLNLEPLEIPLVLSVGETLLPEFRKIIADYFNSWVVDYYANRENTVAAGELQDGRMYTFTDYCYVEFLDASGAPVQDKPGDIIATSLVNYAFPLIRYYTDDVGIDRGYADDRLWPMPTMEMYGGRGKDLILTRRGIFNPRPYAIFGELGFDHFLQLQLVQTSIDEAILKVAPSPEFDRDRELPLIEKRISEYFRTELEMKVDIQLVDHIPRTASGKYRFCISDLAMQHVREKYAGGSGDDDGGGSPEIAS